MAALRRYAVQGTTTTLVLCVCYAMSESGTDKDYCATPYLALRSAILLPGSARRQYRRDPVCFAIGLRARYAMSSTDMSCGAICLRTSYTISSTKTSVLSATSLRACYAVSGTHVAYAATSPDKLLLPTDANATAVCVCSYARATRCPVLTSRTCMVLQPAPRYLAGPDAAGVHPGTGISYACNAISDTDMAYLAVCLRVLCDDRY
eukprot:2935779-Rhodomonas_salina.3